MLRKLRKPLTIVAILLFALMMLGVLLDTVRAALEGRAFNGTSAYGLPVGTYSTLTVFAAAGVVGAIAGVRWLMSRLRARREGRS
jgi:hypothetical protein